MPKPLFPTLLAEAGRPSTSRRDDRSNWDSLSEDVQLTLSRHALLSAAQIIAGQAETLAIEMEGDSLADAGGPEALRLFAAILRAKGRDHLVPADDV